jgi:hypothetical protein
MADHWNRHDQSTERAAWHDFARATREENRTDLYTYAIQHQRRFSRGLDRAEHLVLCGGAARDGKNLFAARSTAPAFGGLHDAEELFVQVPQEYRPAQQRATHVRRD